MTLSLRWALPAVFLLAFLIRSPLLGLPVEGESAHLAAAADYVARGGSLQDVGHAPAVVGALGGILAVTDVSPTVVLRWWDLLAAALLAPLALGLAAALGLRRRSALWVGLLVAVHPLGLWREGGLAPGTGSTAGVLVLGTLLLLASDRVGLRRFALVPSLLLCGTHASAPLLVLPLLLLQALREREPRVQTVGWMLGLAAALFALTGWIDAGSASLDAGSWLWPLGAMLGVLVLGLPAGVRRLRSSPLGRTLLACVGLAAVGWLAGLPFPALVVLPLLLLSCLAGLEARVAIPRPRLWASLAIGGAALVSLGLVAGGAQAQLAPGDPPTAGRLHQLREAVQAAAREAGQAGWIVLAVAGDRPEEQASLADLHPDHWTWSEGPGPGSTPDEGPLALRRLPVFPAASFAAGRHVAVVALANTTGSIQTFGGSGIYLQEVVRRVGPYVVLRAQRP